MSDDVTIDRETASRIAAALRDLAGILGHGMGVEPLVRKWADLLDPPTILRDEVASVLLDNGWTCDYHEPDSHCGECRRLYAVTADAVLAVVRKRVLNLPRHEWGEGGWNVRLDDLIALLEEVES